MTYTARQILDTNISEKQFQDSVIELFQYCGWLVSHSRPARVKDDSTPSGFSWRTAIQGDKGFLDTIATKDGLLIIAELKSEKGEMSPEQKKWFSTLKLVEYLAHPYVRVFMWKPSDWSIIESVAKEEENKYD